MYWIHHFLKNLLSADDASATEKTTYEAHKERSQDVACLMLLSMVPELQKQFEDMEAYAIIIQLKPMFGKVARVERFETVAAILESRQKDDEPVGPYVLLMIRLFEKLESLGVPLGNELATDIIFYTLHKGYANFVVNYHMNSLDKTVHELLEMLKTAEKSIKGKPKKNILMVQKQKNAFKKGGTRTRRRLLGSKVLAKQLSSLPSLKMDLVLTRSAFTITREGIRRRIAQST
ncbi:UNVERIFIED_CONTAM: hypothetical protein Sradi_2061600 [Sesamum radiatum]|uniref:Uncharacterized protein n=1 Tax=Sesamum radiatum TaxID=300843 RepID=A0AAW2TJ68_SESRA